MYPPPINTTSSTKPFSLFQSVDSEIACSNEFTTWTSLVDEIVEPHRSSLIPEFYKLKDVANKAGALGCGISGSGPSVFALTKGNEIANRVADEMKKVFKNHDIGIQCYISKINPNGIKIIPSKWNTIHLKTQLFLWPLIRH